MSFKNIQPENLEKAPEKNPGKEEERSGGPVIHSLLESLEEIYKEDDFEILGGERGGRRDGKILTLAERKETETKEDREGRRLKLQALEIIDQYCDDEANKDLFSSSGFNKEELRKIIKERDTRILSIKERTPGNFVQFKHKEIEIIIDVYGTSSYSEDKKLDRKKAHILIVSVVTDKGDDCIPTIYMSKFGQEG